MSDIAIVGAGLAGLTAARSLAQEGADVVLYEKGSRPGGRCATRGLDGARVDTGAQFFTVRSAAFRRLAATWADEGCPIRVWNHGFAQATSVADRPSSASASSDGHPRHSVGGGMERLARHLARGLDVRTSTCVTAVSRDRSGWAVALVDEGRRASTIHAGAVLLTPPVPQALAVLGSGGVRLPTALATRLRHVVYEPCLVLMVALDRDPGLPEPGGVQFAGGPVAWLGDNVAKGASEVPCLTVHAGASWSETFYDADRAVVKDLLLDLVRPWLGDARPTATQVLGWRYAKPVDPGEEGAVLLSAEPGPAVIAGEALGGAKVEGAVTSGLAAAHLLGR